MQKYSKKYITWCPRGGPGYICDKSAFVSQPLLANIKNGRGFGIKNREPATGGRAGCRRRHFKFANSGLGSGTAEGVPLGIVKRPSEIWRNISSPGRWVRRAATWGPMALRLFSRPCNPRSTCHKLRPLLAKINREGWYKNREPATGGLAAAYGILNSPTVGWGAVPQRVCRWGFSTAF